MWLQGGPGASALFGAFEEIGPLDANLNPRTPTWLQSAHLLFPDSPVGTGYSYVDDLNLLTTNNTQIAKDMVQLLIGFTKNVPDIAGTPFYIFCESYGGKMILSISEAVLAAIDAGTLPLNFKGIGLGDGWVDGLSYVQTWAPFLRSMALMTANEKLQVVDPVVLQCEEAVASGDYVSATNYWGQVENAVDQVSAGVNFYNILNWTSISSPNAHVMANRQKWSITDEAFALAPVGIDREILDQLFVKRVANFEAPLDALLNSPGMRAFLGVIPANVSWGGQSNAVFSALSGDFMVSYVNTLDDLLYKNRINITIYEGQVDLICGVIGAELWMSKLTWPGMQAFYNTQKTTFFTAEDAINPAGFAIKGTNGLSMVYVLQAGHMVPADQPYAAYLMFQGIISQ
jgi:serine carboxypeptidase 1